MSTEDAFSLIFLREYIYSNSIVHINKEFGLLLESRYILSIADPSENSAASHRTVLDNSP
jgi:hypothetical protein